MNYAFDNPYLLLTPGPLSTTLGVREAMLKDWCTWDKDYNSFVQTIRKILVDIATVETDLYTSVLMQGSGTFSVEAAIGTFVPADGKLLILANGAYGERMIRIAQMLRINYQVFRSLEDEEPDLLLLDQLVDEDPFITHIAMVHCETTSGILNPLREVAEIAQRYGKVFMVDAMSSFGGIPLDMAKDHIDILISSSNKCIQGVPGFGFVIVSKKLMETSNSNARSHALDLYDQWKTMEEQQGKWRFTSPTHTVRAFYQALLELEQEGGVTARYKRYCDNHRTLVDGMEKLGFKCFLPRGFQSPIITSFHYPQDSFFTFESFYEGLKLHGFVIYPGKVTNAFTFRIGNIGNVFPEDIERLLRAISSIQTN
jgi:2-aminoethylphosphonate-pyruvate transaminase